MNLRDIFIFFYCGDTATKLAYRIDFLYQMVIS